MNEPLTRDPTEEEFKQTRELASALADVVLTADIATGIGAVGMLLEGMFLNGVKPEYILPGFDDFAQFTRKSIEKAIRRAHN
jgi:hypothetical protein